LRVARVPDPYEALLVAVLGQQISVRAASAIRQRLMLALGGRLEVDGREYYAYPSPERLLAAGVEGLREAGISRQKGRYLLAIAEKAAAGDLERPLFEALSDEEAIALLTQIPGVGRWTAEVALVRGLGRPDVFPAADLGLMVAVHRLMELPTRPTERELRAIAERWAGWGSYAAIYLWATLYVGY
jgi:DNA-3-methyladenine glycosylase II